MKSIQFSLIALLFAKNNYCQNSEMSKFYTFYKMPDSSKGPFDSIYRLIEAGRAAFGKELRKFKETNKAERLFNYNWEDIANQILPSLYDKMAPPLKELIYYSYFDLGYGAYGMHLDSQTCTNALRIIKPSSIISAMEPSLLEAVVKAAGGEDKNASYINETMKSQHRLFG